MTTYNRLKNIIPPDQALANQAISRSLRQVKQIFNADLPSLAQAVGNLETNKGLDQINALTSPFPPSVSNFWSNVFATGTGPGNTITVNDVIGTAAGNTVTQAISTTTSVIQQLNNMGALAPLTGNGGSSTSSVNGVYTVMQYTLAGAYTTSVSDGGDPPVITYTITIPSPLPGAGTYGPSSSLTEVLDDAFTVLIATGNAVISNIASTYSELSSIANQATAAIAGQLAINVENSIAAGIDIGNVVNDPANANLIPNAVSSSLSLVTRLHDIGLDVSEGGSAQFFEQVANRQDLSGQAIISSMREGRNIAVLNAVGINLDTQINNFNPNIVIANNLSNSQYTVDEARANISL
jgi:hypothetical protein